MSSVCVAMGVATYCAHTLGVIDRINMFSELA